MDKGHDGEPYDGRDVNTANRLNDLARGAQEGLGGDGDEYPGDFGEIGLRVPGEDDADNHDKVEEVDAWASNELGRLQCWGHGFCRCRRQR